MAGASTMPKPKKPIDKRIGARVRQLREPLMSQEKAARAVGVSLTQWRNYETGESGISLQQLNKIAKLLDCRVQALLPPDSRRQDDGAG